jgi:hypothetical protein
MSDICVSNGVNKITARGRFANLDLDLQRCLKEVFPVDSKIVVEDWAVSSGITAVEWLAVLRRDYPNVSFTASDKAIYLIEARCEHHAGTYILDPDGAPVQYVRPPFVVSLVRSQSWLYVLNRRLQRAALREWKNNLAAKLRIPSEWNGQYSGSEWISAPPFSLRMLPLIHPEVLQFKDQHFRVRQHSIFSALPAPVDVIRTMNILNRAYFSDEQLREAVAAVERSLKPGGVWVVGRTVQEKPPQHEVSIFRRLPRGWEALTRIGAGSEIEMLMGTTKEASRPGHSSQSNRVGTVG